MTFVNPVRRAVLLLRVAPIHHPVMEMEQFSYDDLSASLDEGLHEFFSFLPALPLIRVEVPDEA